MNYLHSSGRALVAVLAILVGLGAFAPAAEAAAKYPVKAVTVIHGFKPGGGSDQMAQTVQPFLEKVMKQRFVNVYKPGATGAIAWKEVGKDTKPDGYTLTTCLTPQIQLSSMLNTNAGFSMADFEPIANMIFDPGILVVGVDSKLKSFQDLIEAARKAPGQIKISHSGTGGDDWYNGTMIGKHAGVGFNLVPFEGDGPAWQAAGGGHVDAATTNVGVVTGLVQGGKLRGLAVYTDKRLASLPDVPTLKELGVNFVEGSYRGYLAPKGTPAEIIAILADGLEKVSADPQYKAACATISMVPEYKRGDVYKSFLAEKQEILRKIVKEMNLVTDGAKPTPK
jgi:putative tricarboxylic transport membrane protein